MSDPNASQIQQQTLAQSPEEARIASNQLIRDRIITTLAVPENFTNPDTVSLLCSVLNDSDRTSLGVIKSRTDTQANANNAALLDTFARVAGGTGPKVLPSQKRTAPVALAEDVVVKDVVPGETSHEDSDSYDSFAKRMGLPVMGKK